jgi:hypothetical protein
MEAEKVLNLFGHSVNSSEVDEVLKYFGIKERPVYKFEGVPEYRVSNPAVGIYFEFTTLTGYTNKYGEVKSKCTEEIYELFLKEVTFGDKTPYPYQLPFELKFDDDYTTIKSKIGSSPTSKSKADVSDVVYWFLTPRYRVIVRQKEKRSISFVRLFPIELHELKAVELKKSLKSQNKNVSNKANLEILNLKSELPTIDWKQSMLEGDDLFTEKNIADSEALFQSFLKEVTVSAEKKDASKIYSSLEKAVKGFNRLQEKHNGFIETLEREQIIEFLEEAVRLTGFQIEEGLDLTEDIREW